MQSFNDRFSLKYPALETVNIDQVSDAQLESLAPDVGVFADMVKGYSVIIRRRSTKEIYQIATQQVDPRISLILASARDNSGIRIFPNLDAVKSLMFGPDNPAGEFESLDLNIFVEGIRRVSAALTASILIGQLAQIEEQAKHSIILEKQAIADLDRLLTVPDLEAALQSSSSVNDDSEEYSFYFEKKDLDLTSSSLRVEVFMPSSLTTGWIESGTYTGEFSTGQIAADIADTINTITLINKTSNIIAAPVLSGGSGLHKIDFLARERDVSVSAEVITARVSYTGSPKKTIPFKWGVKKTEIEQVPINSLILSVQQGKAGVVSSSSSKATQSNSSPTVLYFRRATVNEQDEVIDYDGNTIPKATWSGLSNLVFRISPNQATETKISIPYKVSANQVTTDKDRPSQVAEALLNGMYAIKGATRALGALIRNDNPNTSSSYSALELIAFSITNPETWLILDVLEIPKDIEIAVGNLDTPITPFSNKPRSIRVESIYKPSAIGISTGDSLSSLAAYSTPSSVPLPSSSFIQSALERGSSWRDSYYG